MQPRNVKRLLLAGTAGILVLAGFIASGAHPLNSRAPAPAETAAPAQGALQPVAQIQARPAAVAALPDFSAIVEQMGPAVVNISVSGSIKSSDALPGMPKLDPNDPFYEFFRRFQPPQGRTPIRGLGSGFIVSPDGIVLTNAHVAANADQVTVKLTDGREFRAKVLGVDKPTDIAVLKIDATNLPTVRIGDSKTIQVGEWVLAIGSPFGFENSATAGIVSATSRSLPDEGYVPFIQTDVAVNPGNSGGPLFNVRGEVIGINSQIYSSSGGYQGLAFAIPIDVAMSAERQIVAHGRVERGRIGVSIQNVNQSLAESFGLQRPMGALVSSVEAGGPAAKAGIQAGDVILKFNGAEINRSSDLPPLVASVKPGTRANLEVWRNGARRELTVTVAELSQAKVAAAAEPAADRGRLGLGLRPLTPDERREARTSGGLMVENADGPAAQAGIQPGDIVLSVNGTPITSVDQMRALVAKAGKHVALLVQRDDAKIFIPIDLG